MKKLLLLLCTLLGTAGAWADVLNVTPADGTYATSSGNYVNTITFATTPALTATASANNMDKRQTTDYLLWHSGSSASSTYTLSVADDYVITAYTITGEANTSEQTLTAGAVTQTFAVGTSSTFTVTGLGAASTSFVQTGANASGLKITAISVTISKPTAEQTAAYEKAQAWPELIRNTQTTYMSSTNQWTSDAADSSEGWLDRLTDGNLTNYFHSDWHNSYSGTHYIEATLPDAVDKLHLYYVTRSTGTGCPTQITVSGSNDGTTWTDNIAAISSNLPVGATKTYFSDALTFANSYSHLRFYIPSTNSGTNSWFCLAEANIYSATDATVEAMQLYHVAAIDLTDTQIARINALDTELRSTSVDVTYNVVVNGTTVATATETQGINNAAAIPSSLERPFTTYAYSSDVITPSTTTITVTPTFNLPFEEGKWYLMTLRGHYVYYSATDSDVRTNQSSYELTDDYQWGFTGNPYTGIKVQNKTTGTYLDNTSSTVQLTTEGYAWTIQQLNNTNTFGLYNGSNYINEQNHSNHNLIYWTQFTTDTGSQFNVEEVPDNFYPMVEAEILPFIFATPTDIANSDPASSIGKPFGISSDGASNIVSTYQTQLANARFSGTEYLAAKQTLEASIVYPEDGKTYIVKNTYNNNYLRVAEHGVRGQVFADYTAEQAAQSATAHVFVRYIDNMPYLLVGGYYFNWVYYNGDGYEAYTTEARASDKYAHFVAVAPGVGAFSLALGNGVGSYAGYLNSGFYALKNGTTTVAGTPTDYTHEYAHWSFEEIEVPTNGDVNMDGETNAADVADLVAYMLGKANIAGGMSINQNAGDMDANGEITLSDITALCNLIQNAQ